MIKVTWALTFFVAAAASVDCSTNSPSSPGGLTLFPTTVYTGLDEGSKYSVPIAASGATGITWSSSDPTIATVTGNDTLATITVVKAGSVTITAKSNGTTATATATAATYTAADKATGQASYTSSGCAKSGCHDSAGPNITPSGIGKHTDAQVLATVTMGANPEGGDISIGARAHTFAGVSTPIVAYLRSLAAVGLPNQDQ